MKYLTRIIPIFCILISVLISILFLDFNQSSDYLNFNGYNRDSFRINYSEDINIDENVMGNILELAHDNNIILAKSNVSGENSSIRNIYVSLDSVSEIEKIINKRFKVDVINNNFSGSFMSTYVHNTQNQKFLIRDFLNNDKYNFYTFETLINEHGNFYGEYFTYYKDYDDFTNFCDELKTLISEDIRTGISINSLQEEIIMILVFSIIIIMLFYFIFEVYDTYYNAKKIGCMKLLGFSINKITNLMFKDKLKVYGISSLIILILVLFLVKNINAFQFLFLLLIVLFLILITYVLNRLCVNIILRGYKTSNIIKKQNISAKISKTSGKLKLVITTLLIIGISLLSNSIIILNDSLKVYNNSKELLDYGVIKDFNADSKEIFSYEKQANLYEILYNDERLSLFYANFSNYIKMTEEEAELTSKWENEGTYFDYASVDRNYLKKENIKIYDLNGNEVNIDDINGVFFLFAKSEEDIIPNFENFYLNDSKDDYEKYNIPLSFQAYLYDDRSFNSYRLDLDIKYVKNPRLRVVDDSIRLSYIESSRGISVFGNSLNTGLKIKVSENTLDYILEDVNKAGLSDLIGSSNFISFKDYFNDEIQNARTLMIFIILGVVLVSLVYIVISVSVFSLYVKSASQVVMVKYLLGFRKRDIFKPIIIKNILYNIIAFIIALIILLVLNTFNLFLFILSVLTFLLIDGVIFILILKKYSFNKIYIDLKGGAND